MKDSYSQIGQDKWVLSEFPINNGYFVDIGFGSPVEINNTYLLEMSGWSGIGVDPMIYDTEPYSNIRPRTKFYQCAIYSESDIEMEFIARHFFSGLKNFVDPNSETMDLYKTNPKIQQIVKTKSLYDILIDAKAPNIIHYLSLDTEGSEVEIIKDFKFNEFIFGCITIEHNKDENKRKVIRDILENQGYVFAKKVHWDDWYIYGDKSKII